MQNLKIKLVWLIGYVLMPYLFYRNDISIEKDIDSTWWNIFVGDDLKSCTGSRKGAVRGAIAYCMTNYDWVCRMVNGK